MTFRIPAVFTTVCLLGAATSSLWSQSLGSHRLQWQGPGMPRGDHRLTDQIIGKHPLWANGGIKPDLASGPTGYTPTQIRHAYGINSLSATGAGQTIAIVDAFGSPTLQSDVAKFSTQFGLAAPSLTIAYPSGTPSSDSGWALETSLDTEWAHAIAPGAKLLVVVAKSDSLTDLLAAVDYAVGQGANQVSMSWGGDEFQGENGFDFHFNVEGVAFLVSSGDDGAGASWPATSPYVIAVGGTSLKLDGSGNVTSETAWSGSGGGVSSYETRPGFQNGFQTNAHRTIPDVSYDADPSTGVAVYISNYQGSTGWIEIGGTSIGAPQWAGLYALANSSLSNSIQLPPAAAYAAANPSSAYAADYRDITSGSDGNSQNAGAGYDLVTGLGSPLANNLIPTLTGTKVVVSPPLLGVAEGGSSLANKATVNFGSLTQGSAAATESFVISNTGGSTLTITATLSSGPFYFVSTPPTSVSAGSSVTVRVGLPTTSIGPATASLVIASNDTTQNPFTVNLTGSVVASNTQIAVSSGSSALPSGGTLSFGSTYPQVAVTKPLTISNGGNSTLSITGYQISASQGSSAFRISGPNPLPGKIAGGSSATIQVAFNPPSVGAFSAQLALYNSATPSAPYLVNLSGTAIANPADGHISVAFSGGTVVSGGTASFGSSPAGTPVVKSFTVTNSGGASLRFYVELQQDQAPRPSRNRYAPPGFTVQSIGSTTLAPTASSVIKVSFDPSATGAYTATFGVGSNDPNAGSYTVTLSGTGQ